MDNGKLTVTARHFAQVSIDRWYIISYRICLGLVHLGSVSPGLALPVMMQLQLLVACAQEVEVDSSQLQRNALPPNFPLATLFFWHAAFLAQPKHTTYTSVAHVTYLLSVICQHNYVLQSLTSNCLSHARWTFFFVNVSLLYCIARSVTLVNFWLSR